MGVGAPAVRQLLLLLLCLSFYKKHNMATRSIVRIIPSKATEQKDCSDAVSRYIYLYHHWDGSPSGVGRELERFLQGRNDDDAPDGTPTWDADRIAEELVNSPSGYVRSDNNHGDVEYGYVIDCGHRKLTCYDLEFGQRSIDNANVIKM